MSGERISVLSVAGLDPSGGAGVLADCKVFEMHQVKGMCVCTTLTFQNENEFIGLSWVPVADIKKQLEPLFSKYTFAYVKIGLIQGLQELEEVIDFITGENKQIKIIWDPIMKASAGFDFHERIDQEQLIRILKKIYLLVPNIPEIDLLNPDGVTPAISAKKLSKYCNILLKGGHSKTDTAEDILFENENRYVFSQNKIIGGEKHGSGCVLSASVTANLAKGYTLVESCRKAKNYTTSFLSSNKGLLGYHYL
jgi:hydroxymethylpyrimidine/phosphomethylpyrimidine kinase